MTKEQLLALFRANMRLIREELGITQSELALRIKVAPGYVCDIERGRRAPNLTTLALISEGLGVAPSTLISTALVKPKWIGGERFEAVLTKKTKKTKKKKS